MCCVVLTGALRAFPQNTVGVTFDAGGTFPGYTLFSPTTDTHAYLVDNAGGLVHRWTSAYPPGFATYLLPDGNLFRGAQIANSFPAGGAAGRVELFNWDGGLLWSYDYSTADHCQHHDAIKLPNGNVIMIAWEVKTRDEAIAAGRQSALIAQQTLWPDTLIEVQPEGTSGGTIVWSWHAWDHLIQDFDASKANYGVVGDHPELIDVNFVFNGSPDWLHFNGIDYNADLDEILVSAHNLGEVWIIDHSTTMAEAAGHSGGLRGRGGDLLYRWGNPQVYRAGMSWEEDLYGQHNPVWIPKGVPGAGHILIFNNGAGRPGGNYTSIEEIVPPVEPDGSYTLTPGAAYGPAAPVWTYTGSPPSSFYAANVSSAQRLSNGNTLIDNGPLGRFFEIDSSGQIIWRYVCPLNKGLPMTQGQAPLGINQVFRATRYATNYPGLLGHDLTPHGTIELQPNATFQLTQITPASNGVFLRWNAVADQQYTVQWTDQPGLNVWNDVGTVPATGTSEFITDTGANGAADALRIYRVWQNP